MFAVSGFGALSFTAYGTFSPTADGDKRQPGEIIVVVFALSRKKPQSHITKYQRERERGKKMSVETKEKRVGEGREGGTISNEIHSVPAQICSKLLTKFI